MPTACTCFPLARSTRSTRRWLICIRWEHSTFPRSPLKSFPLPNLGSFFNDLGRELHYRRGFLLLRGLPRERYSLDDIGLVYYGLGVHLGRPVAQSYQGELLGNVIDVSDIEA